MGAFTRDGGKPVTEGVENLDALMNISKKYAKLINKDVSKLETVLGGETAIANKLFEVLKGVTRLGR